MQLRRLKPDPLNLSVNTGVGKRKEEIFFAMLGFLVKHFLFPYSGVHEGSYETEKEGIQ